MDKKLKTQIINCLVSKYFTAPNDIVKYGRYDKKTQLYYFDAGTKNNTGGTVTSSAIAIPKKLNDVYLLFWTLDIQCQTDIMVILRQWKISNVLKTSSNTTNNIVTKKKK